MSFGAEQPDKNIFYLSMVMGGEKFFEGFEATAED